MAHKIAGNRAAFTGEKDSVWHRIGVYVGDRQVTGAEIIALAGGNFAVREVPMYIQALDGAFVRPQAAQFGCEPYGISIVRDPWRESYEQDGVTITEDGNVPVQLGMIRGGDRKKYVIRQNAETAVFFDELVAAGLLKYTSAAVLERGVGFFIAAEVTEGVVRTNPDGAKDVVKGYATLYNRHDGQSSSKANWSMVRVVCNNTLSAALATGITARINHSGKMAIQFDAAKQELAKGSETFAEVLRQFQAMNKVKATQAIVARLFSETFPVREGEKAKDDGFSKKRLRQITAMTDLMLNGAGNGSGTVYDWFNGVTQFLDHEKDGAGAITQETFLSSMYGTRSAVRDRAFEAAMRVA